LQRKFPRRSRSAGDFFVREIEAMSENDTEFMLADSSPIGKLTAEIKTMEDTDELLTFLASAHRMRKAEYVRNILIEHVHGKAEIVRLRVSAPVRSAR
jgi:hypothetical protein